MIAALLQGGNLSPFLRSKLLLHNLVPYLLEKLLDFGRFRFVANLEVDVIARYVERLIEARGNAADDV